jgi:hypothetical protein
MKILDDNSWIVSFFPSCYSASVIVKYDEAVVFATDGSQGNIEFLIKLDIRG